ncbi:hypothetical protein M436DRAFT_48919, partial [Aureobasidium namibiae CBS 147.97]
RLNGYYAGVHSLIPVSGHARADQPYDPVEKCSSPWLEEQEIHDRLVEYNPYRRPGDAGARSSDIQECFLDHARTVRVPRVHSYLGVPQEHPDHLYGSYDALGLKDDVCFDSEGRLGAYASPANSTLFEHASPSPYETKRTLQNPVDWTSIDWAAAQKRCYDDNFAIEGTKQSKTSSALSRISRQAIVLRTWTGYDYTPHAIMNLRALLSEMSLGSGGEYDIHLLVHVKNNSARFWESAQLYDKIREESVPAEFCGLVTLWSEQQMELVYPGPFCNSTNNRAGTPIHGVYRSSHMPLQHFAQTHTQYKHFWNWEMDIRYIGHYYELFDRLGLWAKSQPRRGIWERSAKYYIEKLHGTWDQFSRIVERENPTTVFGPVPFAGSLVPDLQQRTATLGNEGAGDADLITLGPLFDPNDSGWFFAEDVTGYNTDLPMPPLRNAIIAASRMSSELLHIMHKETFEYKRTMWTEMWAPSIALHYGLKAVYAPHPVYHDRKWPILTANNIFNAGKYGSSGGNASSVFGAFEHNHLGGTWYHNARFAGDIWRAWLGRGSRENKARTGLDRMCLRSMLLHTVKHE